MKSKEINRNLLIIFILILSIGIISGTMITTINHEKSQAEGIQPESSAQITLCYGYWVANYFLYPDSNDYITWSFSGSSSFVGIKVRAMDDTNFWYFDNGYSYSYYSLSSGAYYIDSGTFYPPYEDEWYIVYWNDDPDVLCTLLTYFTTWYTVADTITVTTPTSSTLWETGTSYPIYWNSDGVATVKIELILGDSPPVVMDTVTFSTASDGTYYYTPLGSLPDGTTYRIKITDTSNSGVYDYSDFFEIYTNSITITSPTSSSSWERGTNEYIYWDTGGYVDYVDLRWYKGGILKYFSYDYLNDGDFYWAIPSDCEVGTNWYVRIEDSSDSSVYDVSDNFEIFEYKAITITSPTSSSLWERGTDEHIYWNTDGTIDYVDILWYKGGVLKYYSYDSPNDGDFYWAIPSDCELGTDWYVVVEDSSDSSVYDVSSYFEIYGETDDGGDDGIPGDGNGSPGVPGYNIFLITGAIGIVSIIIIKKRMKN